MDYDTERNEQLSRQLDQQQIACENLIIEKRLWSLWTVQAEAEYHAKWASIGMTS